MVLLLELMGGEVCFDGGGRRKGVAEEADLLADENWSRALLCEGIWLIPSTRL